MWTAPNGALLLIRGGGTQTRTKPHLTLPDLTYLQDRAHQPEQSALVGGILQVASLVKVLAQAAPQLAGHPVLAHVAVEVVHVLAELACAWREGGDRDEDADDVAEGERAADLRTTAPIPRPLAPGSSGSLTALTTQPRAEAMRTRRVACR